MKDYYKDYYKNILLESELFYELKNNNSNWGWTLKLKGKDNIAFVCYENSFPNNSYLFGWYVMDGMYYVCTISFKEVFENCSPEVQERLIYYIDLLLMEGLG